MNLRCVKLIRLIEERSNDLDKRIFDNHSKITTLEEVVDAAITTAVHELIDFLRHDDIQALDEAEFADKVKALIYDAKYCFPF